MSEANADEPRYDPESTRWRTWIALPFDVVGDFDAEEDGDEDEQVLEHADPDAARDVEDVDVGTGLAADDHTADGGIAELHQFLRERARDHDAARVAQAGGLEPDQDQEEDDEPDAAAQSDLEDMVRALADPKRRGQLFKQMNESQETLPDGTKVGEMFGGLMSQFAGVFGNSGLFGDEADDGGEPTDEQREIAERAAEGQFPLYIDDEAGDGPNPDQRAAIEWLQANAGRLPGIALPAIAKWARTARDRYADAIASAGDDPDEVLPPDATVDDIRDRVQFTDATITDRSQDDLAYVELDFECAWDPDDGLQVVLHGDRVVHVGTQMDDWADG
jgi:hypothetical protein